MVDNVRAPIQQLPPPTVDNRLPVVATLIPIASKLDLIDLSKTPRSDNLTNVLKGRLETPVVPNEKRTR